MLNGRITIYKWASGCLPVCWAVSTRALIAAVVANLHGCASLPPKDSSFGSFAELYEQPSSGPDKLAKFKVISAIRASPVGVSVELQDCTAYVESSAPKRLGDSLTTKSERIHIIACETTEAENSQNLALEYKRQHLRVCLEDHCSQEMLTSATVSVMLVWPSRMGSPSADADISQVIKIQLTDPFSDVHLVRSDVWDQKDPEKFNFSDQLYESTPPKLNSIPALGKYESYMIIPSPSGVTKSWPYPKRQEAPKSPQQQQIDNLAAAKQQCSHLGFKPGTPKFGNCVLELTR